jgi:hypothetical protein
LKRSEPVTPGIMMIGGLPVGGATVVVVCPKRFADAVKINNNIDRNPTLCTLFICRFRCIRLDLCSSKKNVLGLIIAPFFRGIARISGRSMR